MHYQLTAVILLGCTILHLTKPVLTYNLTDASKLLCYSCKGSTCENIANHEASIISCNKYMQLCWAGFIDQQPYRTCASRYCTPTGISFDSDIRIETCCHSNLCNSVALSPSVWGNWQRRSSTNRPESSTAATTRRSTTKKSTTPTTQIYIVNEVVNGVRKPGSNVESSEEQDDSFVSASKVNTSDPASFGINWDRVSYEKSISDRAASINKLFLLILPVLLILLF